MKQIFTFGLIAASTLAFGQKTDSVTVAVPKNEIKTNMIYPFWGKVELSYERSLNTRSSIGISTFLDFTDSKNSFYVAPYYRYYCGHKPSTGFFLEAHTLFSARNNNFLNSNSNSGNMLFGIGYGTGYKFVTKKGNWVIEPAVSFGHFLNDSGKTYFRPTFNIGKRF